MSELNNLLNVTLDPLVLGGVTYKFSKPTLAIETQFEAWVEERVLNLLDKRKRTLPPDEWRALQKETLNDIAQGEYAFISEQGQRFLNSFDGCVTLTHLLLKENHPDMTREQVREVFLKHSNEVKEYVVRQQGNLQALREKGEPAEPLAVVA